MELSTRLKTIASFVELDSIIADVGTDHAYIPIFLTKNSDIKYAYAMDINIGPLKKAELNIASNKLQRKIEIRLSDGLAKLKVGEADTLIISGMGGVLIAKILKEYENVTKSMKHLIISPHLDSNVVRHTIHELGFLIEDEQFIKEEDKYYTIISAKQGLETYKMEYYYTYGKVLLANKSTTLKEYLLNKENKYNNILKKLKKQGSKTAVIRTEEIQEEIKELGEVLQYL